MEGNIAVDGLAQLRQRGVRYVDLQSATAAVMEMPWLLVET